MCCEDSFNDENAQRPPQFHEKNPEIGKTKQKEGRERENREILASTWTAPTFFQDRSHPDRFHPDRTQTKRQPTPTHPGGTQGARVGRKSCFCVSYTERFFRAGKIFRGGSSMRLFAFVQATAIAMVLHFCLQPWAVPALTPRAEDRVFA